MGPKKKDQQTSDKFRIKTEKCQYHDSGYCKFGDKCNKKHPEEVCNDKNCSDSSCDKRHSNPCKFGFRCKYNKKKECSYSHVTFASDDEKLDNLEQKFTKNLEVLANNVKEMEKLLTETIKSKEYQINNLEKKIMALENKFKDDNHEDLKKKFKDLENITKKQEKNCNSLVERVFKIEAKNKLIMKCPECDFTSGSKQGLKNHITRKHKDTNIKEDAGSFPRTCDLCETELDDYREMKMHMRLHSFKKVEYKCEECDFCCGNKPSMEVHVGRAHSESFECGLCEFVAGDLDKLETHLFTCEIYECPDCEIRYNTLAEVKFHVCEEHVKGQTFIQIIHAKQNRKNNEEIDCTKHYNHILFPVC